MSTCHGADESHGGRAAVTFQLRRGVDGWRGQRRRVGMSVRVEIHTVSTIFSSAAA